MTGGGVYPALAVLQALKGIDHEVMWIGSESGLEESMLKPYHLRYVTIPAAGLHGTALPSLPANLIQLIKGWQKARTLIKTFKPQKMFFTGGFLGVPVALAGLGIPSIAFVPDVEPGLALKVIIRTASQIALATDRSTKYVLASKPAVVSGYPIRDEIKKWNKLSARKHFRLPHDEPVLLVYGGSKGSRSINSAIASNLNTLLPEMHILHITGSTQWEEVNKVVALADVSKASKYHPYPFLHEDMGAALAAADLVVCRSGASTLGELPFFGLPALLVPYPFAWKYQHQNAEYLAAQNAALLLEDSALEEKLATTIQSLMKDDDKLSVMGRNMKKLAKPEAADVIARMIVDLPNGRQATGGSKW